MNVRERQPDEVVEIEIRIGDVLAFAGHEIGERAADDVVVARMRADEVGIVHPEIVDRLAGLNFDLDLVDDQAFVHHLVVDLNAGDLGEGLGQRLRIRIRGCRGFPRRVLTFIPLNGADALMNHSISAICWSLLSVEG